METDYGSAPDFLYFYATVRLPKLLVALGQLSPFLFAPQLRPHTRVVGWGVSVLVHAAERGVAFRSIEEGETVRGKLLGSVQLASGRFAMIEDGLGFSLVPW